MRQREISIDILKFIAALIITNSHMELLYGKYSALATGGAIGDVLFFFCSGFTLFLGKMGRFDNWYKRRINRIYPTVFAWAIMGAFIFGYHNDMKYTLINGGGWFVTCIMIYYVILYIIRRVMQNKLKWAFMITSIIVIAWYFIINPPFGFNMYGSTYLKWGHYFLFMLLGASLGITNKDNWKYSFKRDGLKALGCTIVYYSMLTVARKIEVAQHLELLSLVPLLGITFYLYKFCNSYTMKKLYYNKYIGAIIKFIGGLCLEIYLVQGSLFTDKMNKIFPLNLLIMLIIIIAVAYILRCLSRIFAQTFKPEDYNWKEVFKAY